MFRSLVPRAEVMTAGVIASRAGELVSHVANEITVVMAELGLDMSSNVIRKLTPAMVEAADRVILMGPVAGGPIPDYLKNSSKLETWNIPDPGYAQISAEGARDMILEKVRKLADQLQ